jgi:tetratricopeptide (TPR) repeat protein
MPTFEKAEVLLSMGQTLERSGDHRAALHIYSRAFDLPQKPDLVWYFLNNNLGYCLNQEGRYQEADKHCHAAIEIDPKRHNAYKNLGLALQGLGRYSEAAESLMAAAIACPEYGRAHGNLEDLIAAHPEILEQDPGLLERLRICYDYL